MRKYLIGFAIVLMLSIGITSYAAQIESMVGKVVQGTFPVYLNGEKFDNEAIIIDGVSYIPVREASEKLGLDIIFDADRGIDLEDKVAQESNTEVIDNTPEFAGLIVSSTNNNLNINYPWFDDPLAEIDPDIRTIEYGNVMLYNVVDFIKKFGSDSLNSKPFFAETDNNYIITKTDGVVVSYIKGNKKQAQVIDGELYLNVKSYPKLPGYPPHKPTEPTAVTITNSNNQGISPKLQLPLDSKQHFDNGSNDIQRELELIENHISDAKTNIRLWESALWYATTEEEKLKIQKEIDKAQDELDDLNKRKAELEKTP